MNEKIQKVLDISGQLMAAAHSASDDGLSAECVAALREASEVAGRAAGVMRMDVTRIGAQALLS
jgi:hypothetical protein